MAPIQQTTLSHLLSRSVCCIMALPPTNNPHPSLRVHHKTTTTPSERAAEDAEEHHGWWLLNQPEIQPYYTQLYRYPFSTYAPSLCRRVATKSRVAVEECVRPERVYFIYQIPAQLSVRGRIGIEVILNYSFFHLKFPGLQKFMVQLIQECPTYSLKLCIRLASAVHNIHHHPEWMMTGTYSVAVLYIFN